MVRSIVLAAGASSRMGQPKSALPLTNPTDTFLSRILRTFAAADLPEIIVVTGASADVTMAAAGRVTRRVRFVHNSRWEEGQLSSLLVGLDAVPRAPLEAVLVTLVDTPLTSADTVLGVLRAWRLSGAPIVRPVDGDRHGHPVIFDRAVFDELRGADPHQGAKAVLRAHAADILDVAVQDEGAFLDIDTPEIYRALLGEFRMKNE